MFTKRAVAQLGERAHTRTRTHTYMHALIASAVIVVAAVVAVAVAYCYCCCCLWHWHGRCVQFAQCPKTTMTIVNGNCRSFLLLIFCSQPWFAAAISALAAHAVRYSLPRRRKSYQSRVISDAHNNNNSETARETETAVTFALPAKFACDR